MERDMIRSQYTNFVPDVADTPAGLLVHGVTGAVDIVAGSLYEAWCSGVPAEFLNAAHRQRLVERGHLYAGSASKEVREFQAIAGALHAQEMASSTNSFWIIPTYRCNLRCAYCFQDHALHRGEGLARRDMTPAEGEHLVDALERFGGACDPGGKGRYITLFGGEPLMSNTRATVEAIVRRARERGYRVGAVTNGVELERFADLTGPDAIRWLQVTLDGPQHLNDKRRIPIGDSAFEAIARGIDMALASGAKVSLRTNVDRAMSRALPSMEAWANARGWTDRRNFSWHASAVEVHANPSLGKVSIDVADLIAMVREAGLVSIKPPYFGKYRKTLSTLCESGIGSRIETSACGAHTSMYFLDPHGDVYACAEQVGQPDYAVGKFEDWAGPDGPYSWTTRHVGNMPVCSRCPNAFFCGGGCANAALQSTNDFFAPRCNGIQAGLQAAGRDFAARTLRKRALQGETGLPDLISINEDALILSGLSPVEYVKRVTCVPS